MIFHAPELLDRGLHERFDLGTAGHVHGHGGGQAAGSLDVRNNAPEPIPSTGAEEHLGAPGRKVARGRLAEPAARSCDDHDLALDACHVPLAFCSASVRASRTYLAVGGW
jgi:hypothetical protein